MRTFRIASAWMVVLIGGGVAWGQADQAQPEGEPSPVGTPEAVIPDAGEQEVKAPSPQEVFKKREADFRKKRSEMERELKRIRAKFIRNVRNTELRQLGIMKIREYTDPAIYPSLLEIFSREGDDVRGAILDHLVEIGTEDADATLAWAAIFEKDRAFRELARGRLLDRQSKTGEVPWKIKSVVAQGLRDREDDVLSSAAEVARLLKLAEAIPMMINAQVGGGARGEEGRGALAWILIGQQQAFVSDLTPVVGDSAVAFDPELSVVTTGTIIRVFDAAVVTYRVDVHNSLIGLSSELWGRSTAGLGWDQTAWREWYLKQFLPSQRDRG